MYQQKLKSFPNRFSWYDEAVLPGLSERYEPVLESMMDEDMDQFKMSKRRFHGMNPQVCIVICAITYRYVQERKGTHCSVGYGMCVGNAFFFL